MWNRAGLVREAIDSVLAQDFEDWELVVVDDGSQDGTAAAIATVDDPRIRGLRLPSNRGAGAARNRGAAAARAELVCFLASPESAFVNGAVWTIDGGSLAWRGTLDVLGMEAQA